MVATSAPQAPRADQLVLDIALAYSRLGPHAHRSLAAFMAGDHSIKQAHDTALQIVATTNQEDLVLILARLLVMADDEVGEQEPPLMTRRGLYACADSRNTLAQQQQRRRDDNKTEG